LLYLGDDAEPTAFYRRISVAHVAELADALDSGFRFRHFLGVAHRYRKIDKDIAFIGRKSVSALSEAAFDLTCDTVAITVAIFLATFSRRHLF
jgi:hypothetical protein